MDPDAMADEPKKAYHQSEETMAAELRGIPGNGLKCNLCNSRRHKIFYSPKQALKDTGKYTITQDISSQPYEIVQCTDCGLIYSLCAKDSPVLLQEYSDMRDEQYTEEASGRRRAARAVLDEAAKLKRPGRLLEVGSAAGFFLDEARQAGWEVVGIEPSKWAAGYAKENFAVDIINKHLEDVNLVEGSFDLIVMIDVFEHLIDPKSALAKLRRLLKDDGILYIATPDMKSLPSRVLKNRWWGIKSHHLYYFSKNTLKAMLGRTGFEVIRFSSYRRYFRVGYLAKLFGAYNGTLAGLLKSAFRHTSIRKKEVLFNLCDQIGIYARKKRVLEDFISSGNIGKETFAKMKTVIVLPAYNAEKTLKRTLSDIPDAMADDIILVDDKSADGTVRLAKELGLKVFAHDKNSGYGANQKTCYEEALRLGADIVVMLHPDYQYDPRVIPELIEPIKKRTADAVFGSRMMKGGALEGGMPKWKHNANILLTAIENVVLGTYLTEYHSGFRAYSRRLLESIDFKRNSDGFIFDTEIIVQTLLKGLRIEEIPIKTRYFDEASTVGFFKGCVYGLGIFKTLIKYILHTKGIIRFKQFE